MANKLITRKQLAEDMAVKPATVKQWQRTGRIVPDAYVNGRPRYDGAKVKKSLTAKPPTQ